MNTEEVEIELKTNLNQLKRLILTYEENKGNIKEVNIFTKSFYKTTSNLRTFY
jgi:hypothetical protein